jgi:hypothetical protein
MTPPKASPRPSAHTKCRLVAAMRSYPVERAQARMSPTTEIAYSP